MENGHGVYCLQAGLVLALFAGLTFNREMRILGVDPGFGLIGFGLVQVSSAQGSRGVIAAEEWGTISTTIGLPDEQRLMEAYTDFTKVLTHFQPDVVAIEKIFYFRNQTTIIPVTQARGVLLLALAQAGISYFEYTPMQVKQAVTGSGKAKKPEVQQMVTQLLGLEKIPRPDDAADALAVAMCHQLHSRGSHSTVSKPTINETKLRRHAEPLASVAR